MVYLVSDTKQLATLNNVRAQLKSVLNDLRARNFVHAKTSLRARCMHARHRARNLSSPVYATKFLGDYWGNTQMLNINQFK